GVSVEKATITRARMEEILVNAIEADRKRGGEPSSLAEVWRINADEAEAYGQPDRADTLRECAAEVERLAAPQPAEPVDTDLVQRWQREHGVVLTPGTRE